MSVTDAVLGLLLALAGTVAGSLLSLVPALHIYNVAGLTLLGVAMLGPPARPEWLGMFFLGLATSYSMVSVIPSIFLSAPDDSLLFVVLPGQKYLMQGRGYEAAALTGVGGLGGILALALLTPFASALLAGLRAILQQHLHWILWAVIAYMLMSEWPKGSDRAPAGWRRWWDAWRSLVAGLATFLFSGLLGFILMYRSVLPVTLSYQNLLPAFVGLFAVPWILQNLLARVHLPPQFVPQAMEATPGLLVRGIFAGALGGGLAAFLPVVSGGIGGLLAGHATAQRDDRVFLVSQGASRAVYYVGGLLLFFVPGSHVTRGGLAWMLSTLWNPRTPHIFYLAVAAVLLSGVLAFLLLFPLAQAVIWLVGRVHYRWISLGTLGLLLGLVGGLPALAEELVGLGGAQALHAALNSLLVCAVATGIGLFPVVWGSRRTNCMGILLAPVALNMAGAGAAVAEWLGLIR